MTLPAFLPHLLAAGAGIGVATFLARVGYRARLDEVGQASARRAAANRTAEYRYLALHDLALLPSIWQARHCAQHTEAQRHWAEETQP